VQEWHGQDAETSPNCIVKADGMRMACLADGGLGVVIELLCLLVRAGGWCVIVGV
jgi:hypothetical protein